MALTILVLPHLHGWAVRSAAFENDMLFRSGAKAEAAARRLGRNLADHGQSCEIRVVLRDGTIAGRFVCVASDPALSLAV
jgi:hypothetical protein